MADPQDALSRCTGFQWDEGNAEKNWLRHQVSRAECEQVFFNLPLVTVVDDRHSQQERRYFALGQTDGGRRLFLVFTVRDDLVRVISARTMSRRERKAYERGQEEDPASPK